MALTIASRLTKISYDRILYTINKTVDEARKKLDWSEVTHTNKPTYQKTNELREPDR
jgi:hypothetical protein